MNKIGFVKIYDIDERYYPVPTSSIVPDWYKKTSSYLNNVKRPDEMSIKRCIPVFDAMTSGYTLLLHADIFVTIERNETEQAQITQWSPSISFPFIDSHSFDQFKYYPGVQNGVHAGKITNPFAIVTPKGYSCLFSQPMHQPQSPIRIFEGIVDTDKHHIVNFPFVYFDHNFEGLIPAGTPLVQITPFKRESWKLELDNKEHKKLYEKNKKGLGSNLFGQYREFFWDKKEYK